MVSKKKITVRVDEELDKWLDGIAMEGKSKEQIIATLLHAAMVESKLPMA